MNDILKALDPNYILVDERTVRDRLYFVARFAEQIYFYDEQNKKNGNWSPFFLKDPAILLAYISKTNYKSHFAAYSQIIRKWEVCQDKKAVLSVKLKLQEQLFFMLHKLFVTINRWVVDMEMCDKKYPLKEFVNKQVVEIQSTNLSDVLALWNWWTPWLGKKLKKKDATIQLPDFNIFEKFQEPWSTKKIGKSLADLLSKKHKGTPKKKTVCEAFSYLQRVHRDTFDFYVRVINNAGSTFEQMIKEKQDPFPDSLLTIIFVKLMESQKEQLNKLTRRHMDFYYKNILDQKEAVATLDEAFVFINLNPNTETFEIPADFQFSAGVDKEQKPVIFESEKDSVVNRTAINQLFTLSPQYLRHIEKPSTIKKNELGEVLTWKTFGNSSENITIKKELTQVKPGFALASPMLLLKRGTRVITLTLKWSKNYAPNDQSQLFKDCEFYLSTEKKWYQLEHIDKQNGMENKSKGTVSINDSIIINLPVSSPPIVPFKKNPDKLTTSLPMLKVVFPTSFDSSQQIRLEEIDIQVVVTGITRFTLSNDNGLLPAGSTFLPFGSVPSVGSRFSLENPELCKPNLCNLTLTIEWNQLPGDFSQYYSAYNSYLNSEDKTVAYFYNEAFRVDIEQQTESNNPVCLFQQSGGINNQKSTFLFNGLSGETANGAIKMILSSNNGALLFKPNYSGSITAITTSTTFTGKIAMTANCIGHITMTPTCGDAITMEPNCTGHITMKPTISGDTMTITPTSNFNLTMTAKGSSTIKGKITMTPNCRGSITTNPTCSGTIIMTLSCSGQITMTPIGGDAITITASCIDQITMTPTTSGDTITMTPTGFISIIMTSSNSSGTLSTSHTETEYAFGNDLYPKVVSWISLENAILISDASKSEAQKKSELKLMPNLPYAPKIKEVTVSYTAKTTQSFSDNEVKENAYPFEYYHYSPFGAYPVFFSTTHLDYGVLAQGEDAPDNAVDLFPYIPAKGILYLSLKNLPPLPATLSLYFEMAENKGTVNDPSIDQGVKFWILGTQGWQSLTPLEDGTAHLNQSGNILLPVPEDIFQENPMMPIDEYWLSITCETKEELKLETVYVNTQAVKVKRVESNDLAPGITPMIKAGKIVSPTIKTPEIKEVLQPFNSRDGRPAETTDAFYQRVSRRIKTKDRALSKNDYAIMALEADPQLAYVKCLPEYKKKIVRLELVQSYPDTTQPTAFRPVVPSHNQLRLQNFFQKRVSPFVNLEMQNMKHQEIQVKCALFPEKPENWGMVKKQLNEELRLFLSPWIQSEQMQIPMDKGIRRSELISFLSDRPEVVYVNSIKIGSKNNWCQSTLIEEKKKICLKAIPTNIQQRSIGRCFSLKIKRLFLFPLKNMRLRS